MRSKSPGNVHLSFAAITAQNNLIWSAKNRLTVGVFNSRSAALGSIAAHMAVLAGTDFFTVEVLTWRGLATYYVLFFIQLDTRRVTLAGLTMNPTKAWMEQLARNAVDPENGHLRHQRYILHDRDTKFCASLRAILETEGVTCMALPPHSPNLNAFAECWVRSAKQECLRKLVLFGEGSLRRALSEYITHYHEERNH